MMQTDYTEALDLTNEQRQAVADLISVTPRAVATFLDAVNDVLHADPPGTIRRHPSGRILAVRQASLTHPWRTFVIDGKSASWVGTPQAIAKWEKIADPVEAAHQYD
ncbi:hypothetical protein SEA_SETTECANDELA_201 [Mycobacterium phage Settecandela]|nr:hypothetical protein SEA_SETTECANDELA_201 [Mycobacterium phage Settecandela]